VKFNKIVMKYQIPVKDVMNKKLVFVEPETDIREIAKIIKKKKIGCVLVKNEHIKGIVTTRDIVYKYLAQGIGKCARDIMTKPLITISPTVNIEDAAAIMVKNKIERLPVMHFRKVIGVISTNDILKVEPELYKNLLEGIKIGKGALAEKDIDIGVCDSCGAYSDDLKEVNGQWLCPDCREE